MVVESWTSPGSDSAMSVSGSCTHWNSGTLCCSFDTETEGEAMLTAEPALICFLPALLFVAVVLIICSLYKLYKNTDRIVHPEKYHRGSLHNECYFRFRDDSDSE